MRNVPVNILSANSDATRTGAAIFVGQYVAASFTCVFVDATAGGTVKIQGSNDLPVGEPSAYTPATASWSDITSATSTIASGVGPAIVLAAMNFQYIRAVFTRTGGGASNFTVNMSALAV
jgi:hypothetical protein